jgi:hypothetical protein
MKWQYRWIDVFIAAGSYPEMPDRESIKKLEQAGEEGWEVVNVVEIRAGYLLLLAKRPQE